MMTLPPSFWAYRAYLTLMDSVLWFLWTGCGICRSHLSLQFIRADEGRE